MAKMTIDHYTMRPLWSEQTTAESRNALSEFEKRLANHFCIVEIPGKRGKKVPVLLSPEMKTAIDLLLKTRTMGGISKENPFVFARAGNSLGHMRGHDCIRKCIANVDLQMPENINGTKLRKYIATVSQIMNMTENETDWLARHLGHDIHIHREFYRLHESAVELTKISRLLMVIDNGEAHKFHGKKLNEIELTDLPQLQLDEVEDTLADAEAVEFNELVPPELDPPPELKEASCSSSTRIDKKNLTKTGKKCIQKRTWTEEESTPVIKFFTSHIKRGAVPGKSQCEECIQKHPSLSLRKWTDIKFYIKNYITKIKKKGI
ncbi:uncharacterized protein [Leptinotarsa decemlineata]|uniref:uncharacterized protein n=1 Tax=Leptinotarsa decemlineata TaxID=7539 RepID=UPI003D30A75B